MFGVPGLSKLRCLFSCRTDVSTRPRSFIFSSRGSSPKSRKVIWEESESGEVWYKNQWPKRRPKRWPKPQCLRPKPPPKTRPFHSLGSLQPKTAGAWFGFLATGPVKIFSIWSCKSPVKGESSNRDQPNDQGIKLGHGGKKNLQQWKLNKLNPGIYP